MLRGATSKVIWVGRATVFLVGVAVILAIVFGVASTAMGANGDSLILGKAQNTAARTTGLLGDIPNRLPTLRLQNNGAGPALTLRVGGGGDPAANTQPPMRVNSQARVNNLNADQLDGNHAGAFLGSDVVVRTDNDDLDDGDTAATNTALCQDGEVATGGGAALVLDGAAENTTPRNGAFIVAASRPALVNGADQPPTGWQASIFDRDGNVGNNGIFTLRVYAVCTNVGAAASAP